MFFKEIVDLGRELFNGMPNLGANITAFFPLETYAATRRFSQGRLGFEGRMIMMAEHCGTHLDCPYHFDPDGLTVDRMPLDRLILPGHLLDLTHKGVREPISVSDVQDAVQRSGRSIRPGTVVIFWTGRDKDWGQEGFKTERPYIPAETAQWLVDQHVTLFATDLIGLDNPDEWWEPTHVAFLKNGLPMVQQLCNLERLVGKEFLSVCRCGCAGDRLASPTGGAGRLTGAPGASLGGLSDLVCLSVTVAAGDGARGPDGSGARYCGR